MSAPDYKRHDPKGWGGDPSRGAALGRALIMDAPKDYSGKIHVTRVRIDRGGYDQNGTYWGAGAPLYWCTNDTCDDDIDFVVRAADRESARQRVLDHYPNARIRK